MKLSIITISYNSERTIRNTIDSVLSQGYPDLEYIIIDGASTDHTLDIVKEYGDKITKIVSEKDNGISDAFNKGISFATGDVIGIINSDDMYANDAFRKVSIHMNDDTDVFYADGYRMLQDGTLIDYNVKPLTQLKDKMTLVHSSTFVRKSAYDEFGGFEIKYKVCMDRELFQRFQVMGAKFQYFPDRLSIYRMGGVSDETFFTQVEKEREEISLRYGRPYWLVKMTTLKTHAVMWIKKFKK